MLESCRMLIACILILQAFPHTRLVTAVKHNPVNDLFNALAGEGPPPADEAKKQDELQATGKLKNGKEYVSYLEGLQGNAYDWSQSLPIETKYPFSSPVAEMSLEADQSLWADLLNRIEAICDDKKDFQTKNEKYSAAANNDDICEIDGILNMTWYEEIKSLLASLENKLTANILSTFGTSESAKIITSTAFLEPPGSWTMPRFFELSSQHSAHIIGCIGISVGESAIDSNYFHLSDPRPAAHMSLLPEWFANGITRALESHPGHVFLTPPGVRISRIPNHDQDVARVYITFAMEGVKNSSHDGLCVGKESACEWPTPILHAVVPTEPETQATLVNWFKYLERSEECMTKSNKGGFQSATNLFERIAHSDLKDLQSLEFVRENAYFALIHYLNATWSSLPGSIGKALGPPLGESFVDIHAAWAAINRVGDSNFPHVHPDAELSGVYYVSVGDDRSPLYFIDPRRNKNDNPQQHLFSVHPKNGSLVLFPSYLEHFVPPQKRVTRRDKTLRVVLPFNAQVRHYRNVHTGGKFRVWIPQNHSRRHKAAHGQNGVS
eukprot:m.179570 g.179570  ORF g.179570 m.179570 type:complete len:552 (-) comp15480_c0_seq2:70-1725(-)